MYIRFFVLSNAVDFIILCPHVNIAFDYDFSILTLLHNSVLFFEHAGFKGLCEFHVIPCCCILFSFYPEVQKLNHSAASE